MGDPLPFSYCNPIISPAIASIRDCQIIAVGGVYYLTGTSPPYWTGVNDGIRLYTSTDLLAWHDAGLILARDGIGPRAWYRDRFWAPEIHQVEGRFLLLFNCRNDATGFVHSCGIALADAVRGPYRVLSAREPLVPNANDLTLFQDRDAAFVYWAAPDAGIFGQEIDLRSFRLLGMPFHCLDAGRDGAWDAVGIEGPWVVRRQGRCFMYYSSWTRGYEVGYAIADHPRGPWRKSPANPLIGRQGDARGGLSYAGAADCPYAGVGHNATFAGPAGLEWLVCHYQIAGQPESLGFDPVTYDVDRIEVALSWTPRTVGCLTPAG
jgi:xylan 1,4-beta-xylosidase